MSKAKKQIGQTKLKQDTVLLKFDIDKIIPQKYQTASSLVILLLLFLIFFSPLYFGGKTFQSGDIVTSNGMVDYLKHGDGYTLWNPYIFCGMPAYAISVGYKWFNLIYVSLDSVRKIFTVFFSNNYSVWTSI